ncbi:DUF2087 domain-containing protein [Rhizobium sp. SGZ-381]|uniref:DUF2087 domain-containing protein n=1 Tax=Rhizobium sp. SGZ-381 TaxID=3342800 RepID=UPI00366ED8F8
MSRIPLSITVPDVSALAKAIRHALEADESRKPGHVELLNILARGAGFRNFQHLKASHSAEMRLAAPEPPPQPEPEAVDHRRIEQVLRCFDQNGVLVRWPKKTQQQKLALWWCWSLMPGRTELPEPQVNELLKRLNGFGDHVLMRREMVDWGMMTRSTDCRLYRRTEVRPPADALVLIQHLQARIRARAVPRVSNRLDRRAEFRQARPPARPAALPTSP